MLLLLAWPAAAEAQLTYYTNDYAITITGYGGPGGAVAIPSEINGFPVTGIANGAFAGSALTSVTIPSSVTGVGEEAFFACASLASATIGNGVVSLGQSAFGYCPSLTSIAIPDSVASIGVEALEGCTSLGSVTIGNGVTSIGDSAFRYCSSLTSAYFLGNAPGAGSVVFVDDPVTVYYLQGTTGWGATFSGSPAVLVAPLAITLQPQSQRVNPGDNATFTVAANSAAPLSYQWLLNAAAIGGATTNSYTVIAPPEGGSYSVVVSDFAGSVTSAAAVLTVQVPNPTTVTVVSGLTANNKTYDGTTSATLSSNNVVLAGVLPADAGNVALSTNGYTAAFASAALGAGQTVSVSGLSLTGSAAGNYSLTQPSLTANVIAGAPVTITSGLTAISKTYDGTTSAALSSNNVVLAGVASADAGMVALSTNGYTATFASAGPGAGISVAVGGLGLTGSAAANYSLTQPILTANITAAGAQFTYATSNGAVTITGYIGPGGAVTIPSEINGLPVTGIGAGAFEQSSLTSITIPDSVTNIGALAFQSCTNLVSVTIGNRVTSIGLEAFAYCGSLSTIAIPDSVTSLGDEAFYSCTKLASVTLGNGVTSIGDSAFWSCASLTSIAIPDSVTSLGGTVFYSCASLASATIGAGVTNIGQEAFYSCTNLTTVTIGNSVASVGVQAFALCTHLTSIAIPNSVTSLGASAFQGCTSLTSATIGNSVTSLGGSAFWGCTGLTSATIGNSVTAIAGSAFLGCTSLAGIAIPNSVTTIGGSAFSGCTSLSSVAIPNSVTSIGEAAFWGCTSLASIAIPNTVTSIGGAAFQGSGLTSVTIPDAVNDIAQQAFAYCPNLASVTIPDGVIAIEEDAFTYCPSLTSIAIPNSVTYIGVAAFDSCGSLASVTIGSGINYLDSWAFAYNVNLTGVYFLGNAPPTFATGGTGSFAGDPQATVYYLRGMTGFGTTVDGLPAVLVVPPVITLQPQSQTVGPGENATLIVAATSAAPLSYQWFFNGAAIGGATANSYTAIGPPDGGSYFVVVSNFAGPMASATAVLTVQGASLATVTIVSGLTANNKLYDGTTSATLSSNNVVLAGVAAADAGNVALSTNGYTAAFASAFPGTALSVTVSGLSLTGSAAAKYSLTQPILAANITPATLMIASGLTANNKLYDGTTSATLSSNNVVLAGILAAEAGNVALSTNGYTAAFASAAVGPSQSVTVSGLSLTGSAAGNYALSQPTLTANIMAAPLLVSADDQTRAFGHTNPVWTVSYTGFVGGDGPGSLGGGLNFSFADTNGMSVPSVDTNTTVGTYVIIPSGLTSGTYALTYAEGTLQITQAVLTVAAKPAAKVYGTANPAFSATISGFLDGDDAGVVSGTPQLSTSAGVASSVGVYDVVGAPGTLSATNYSFSFANGTLTVLPAPLTVIGNNATRLYGAANPPFTGTIAGLLNGDLISASFVALAGPASPVGADTITAGLSGATSTLDNYTLSITLGTLQVLPAPLTITANNAARLYGTTNPPFTGTITGVQNGDNITATYSCSAGPASPPGAYPIVPAPASPGNLQTNYQVTLVDGTLTIVAPPLLQAVAQSGGTLTLSWSATAGQSYQVQYTSDLSEPLWTKLVIITATNSTATASDALSSSAQRFYRTLWQP